MTEGDEGTPRETDDEVFNQIVAGFNEQETDPVPRWPVSEDLPATESPRWTAPPRDPEPFEGLPGWLEPEALEDSGHFEPPPPPKVPRLRPRTLVACSMFLVGLAVLFAPFRIGLDDSGLFLLLGLLLTGGGAGLLVMWMRDAPPIDSGPDDGAVV